MLNNLRGSGQNRPFLQVDPMLTMVARAHAADMIKRNYFDHVNPDGHGPNWMVRNAGYPLPDWWGYDPAANYVESIAAGQTSVDQVWSDWMGSSDHRPMLLATDSFYQDQTSVGLAFVSDSSSQYGTYWVVITAPPRPMPTLTVATPTAWAQVLTPEVTVSGTTGGSVPATSVVFRVENSAGTGSFTPAAGAASFTGLATGLVPGANTIRIRSLNALGVTLAEVAQPVLYVVPSPLTVTVAGSGSVTAGFLGASTRNLGFGYNITATPAPGMIFAGWSGSVSSKLPTLHFAMAAGEQLTATFIPNPFPSVQGKYLALLTGSEEGRVRFIVASNGIATASVTVGGVPYTALGRLAADGSGTFTFPRPGQPALHIAVQLDLSGSGGMSGTLTDGSLISTFSNPMAWSPTSAAYPHAGRYTLALPPNPASTDTSLMGVGYATLLVGSNGIAQFSGVLANGRTFTYGTTVSVNDTLPIYIPFSSTSALSGMLTITPSSVSDLQGSLHWTRAANPAASIHPDAIDTTLPVVGSLYVRPAAGTPVVTVPNAVNNSAIVLQDGNLNPTVTQPATLNGNSQLVLSTPVLPGFNAGINLANGIYRGSFIHPVTHALSPFSGVIFQKQDAGYGLFLTASASGSSSLTPVQ